MELILQLPAKPHSLRALVAIAFVLMQAGAAAQGAGPAATQPGLLWFKTPSSSACSKSCLARGGADAYVFCRPQRRGAASAGSCCRVTAGQTWSRAGCGVPEGAGHVCTNEFYTLAQQSEQRRRSYRRAVDARPGREAALRDFARLSHFACPADAAICGR